MSNNPRNDIYYTASLLEYLSRKTKNRRADVARLLGVKGISGVYEFAEVNHCLSFDQVADELIEACHIPQGDYDPEQYFIDHGEEIPAPTRIGKSYANLVCDIQPDPLKYPQALYDILCSKISEWMTDYYSAFYYSPRDYILYRYKLLREAQTEQTSA